MEKNRVLIIEDEAQARDTLRVTLTKLGYEVTLTDTAEGALEELQRGPFDVILAALCVRVGGARTVARWVKANHPRTRFLVTTSWRGELETDLLRLDGIEDVIRKPFSFNEIRDKLGNRVP